MGADFRGHNLSGANLSCADLDAANLSGANLSGADLTGADLIGAKIQQRQTDSTCARATPLLKLPDGFDPPPIRFHESSSCPDWAFSPRIPWTP